MLFLLLSMVVRARHHWLPTCAWPAAMHVILANMPGAGCVHGMLVGNVDSP